MIIFSGFFFTLFVVLVTHIYDLPDLLILFSYSYLQMLNPPPGFRFGTLKSSSTEAYFKFNRDPRMRKIYQNMKDHSVGNVHDGVKKVKSG